MQYVPGSDRLSSIRAKDAAASEPFLPRHFQDQAQQPSSFETAQHQLHVAQSDSHNEADRDALGQPVLTKLDSTMPRSAQVLQAVRPLKTGTLRQLPPSSSAPVVDPAEQQEEDTAPIELDAASRNPVLQAGTNGDVRSLEQMITEAKAVLGTELKTASVFIEMPDGSSQEVELFGPLGNLPEPDGNILSPDITDSFDLTANMRPRTVQGQANKIDMAAADSHPKAWDLILRQMQSSADRGFKPRSKANVATAMNLWRQFCVCVARVLPYRLSWAQREDISAADAASEDSLMLAFAHLLSKRFDTHEAVAQYCGHVIGFHKEHLGLPPPKMPIFAHWMPIIERRMLSELGRRAIREGLLPVDVAKLCAQLRREALHLSASNEHAEAAQLASILLVLAFSSKRAMRLGSMAMGKKEWLASVQKAGPHQFDWWTRATLEALVFDLDDGDGRTMSMPRTKTDTSSRMTQEITSRPWFFYRDDSDPACVVNAAKLVLALDECDVPSHTPAARDPTKKHQTDLDIPAMDAATVIKAIRERLPSVLPHLDPARISGHSLRIGASIAFAGAGATEEEQRAQGTWTSHAQLVYKIPIVERVNELTHLAAHTDFMVMNQSAMPAGPIDHRHPTVFPKVSMVELPLTTMRSTDGQITETAGAPGVQAPCTIRRLQIALKPPRALAPSGGASTEGASQAMDEPMKELPGAKSPIQIQPNRACLLIGRGPSGSALDEMEWLIQSVPATDSIPDPPSQLPRSQTAIRDLPDLPAGAESEAMMHHAALEFFLETGSSILVADPLTLHASPNSTTVLCAFLDDDSDPAQLSSRSGKSYTWCSSQHLDTTVSSAHDSAIVCEMLLEATETILSLQDRNSRAVAQLCADSFHGGRLCDAPWRNPLPLIAERTHASLNDTADSTPPPVLTVAMVGGPCAGKSCALKSVPKTLAKEGIPVFPLTEKATQMLRIWPQWCQDEHFQLSLALGQRENEIATTSSGAFLAATKLFQWGRASAKPVILLDRCIACGHGFSAKADWAHLLTQVGRSHDELLAGYDAIAHLKIVPKHSYSVASNEIRMPSYSLAHAADKKLYEETFHSHPKVILCDNRGGLKSKVNKVCKLVRHHLSHQTIPSPFPSAASDDTADKLAAQDKEDPGVQVMDDSTTIAELHVALLQSNASSAGGSALHATLSELASSALANAHPAQQSALFEALTGAGYIFGVHASQFSGALTTSMRHNLAQAIQPLIPPPALDPIDDQMSDVDVCPAIAELAGRMADTLQEGSPLAAAVVVELTLLARQALIRCPMNFGHRHTLSDIFRAHNIIAGTVGALTPVILRSLASVLIDGQSGASPMPWVKRQPHALHPDFHRQAQQLALTQLPDVVPGTKVAANLPPPMKPTAPSAPLSVAPLAAPVLDLVPVANSLPAPPIEAAAAQVKALEPALEADADSPPLQPETTVTAKTPARRSARKRAAPKAFNIDGKPEHSRRRLRY